MFDEYNTVTFADYIKTVLCDAERNKLKHLLRNGNSIVFVGKSASGKTVLNKLLKKVGIKNYIIEVNELFGYTLNCIYFDNCFTQSPQHEYEYKRDVWIFERVDISTFQDWIYEDYKYA